MFLFPHSHFVPRLAGATGKSPRSPAFTLTELLVVLALVAALSGVLVRAGRHVFETGRVASARAELAVLSAALDQYRSAHGDYPPSLDALGGGAVPLDPWRRPYCYAYKSQAPWTNPVYVLCSAGPDGLANEALRAGGFPNPEMAGNGDNLWANQP